MAQDPGITQKKQMIELRKHRAHAAFLLAEKVGWGQRSTFKYRDLLQGHSNSGKV